MNSARYAIISTIVLWIGLDVYLYLNYGNPATESATIWYFSYYFPCFPFSTGALCGHLFGQRRAPSDAVATVPTWVRVGEIVMLIAIALWLVASTWCLLSTGQPTGFDNFIWTLTFHRVWAVFFIAFGLGSFFLRMDEPTTFAAFRLFLKRSFAL